MKRLFLFLYAMLVCVSGCNPRNAGVVGNFYNGFYRLDSYAIRGVTKPNSMAPDYTYLETQADKDSTYFIFKDGNRKIMKRESVEMRFDVNKDRTVGYYDLETADGRFGKATLTVNKKLGENIKLELSNFMKGGYNRLSDTLRYIYLPE